MSKAPAFQFYTGDWLKDPNLSMCSPATRGIWIDLISAMHENDRSGLITGTTEQIARLSRCTTVELGHAIDELQSTKTADVTKRHEIVTIINRRMFREYKERVSARERKRLERDRNTSGKGCHTYVTPSRARSSSSSSSFKENISLSRDTKESALIPANASPSPAQSYHDRFTPDGQDIRRQALEVLHYLNERCVKAYHDTYPGIRHIIDRLNENFSVADLKYIVDTKLCDPHFLKNRNLLSPDTLFRKENAEKYRYEKPEDFTGGKKTDETPKAPPVAEKLPPTNGEVEAYAESLLKTFAAENKRFRETVIEPMKDEINTRSWKAFIMPLIVAGERDGVLVLFTSNSNWMNENYKAFIEEKWGRPVMFTNEIPQHYVNQETGVDELKTVKA